MAPAWQRTAGRAGRAELRAAARTRWPWAKLGAPSCMPQTLAILGRRLWPACGGDWGLAKQSRASARGAAGDSSDPSQRVERP